MASCSFGSFPDYIFRFQLLFSYYSPFHAMSSALSVCYRLIWCNDFVFEFALVASPPSHNSPSRLYIRFVDLFGISIKYALPRQTPIAAYA